MSSVKRSSDLGPWGDILAAAESADSDLTQYLFGKVQRTAIWLSLAILIGLFGVTAIWIDDSPTTGVFPGIGAGFAIAGIFHGKTGARKARLAGKVAGEISKDGSSVRLMRRYRLMYRIFQLSCFGLLAGFVGRIIGFAL
jgi:hypothetical protein